MAPTTATDIGKYEPVSLVDQKRASSSSSANRKTGSKNAKNVKRMKMPKMAKAARHVDQRASFAIFRIRNDEDATDDGENFPSAAH